CRPEHGRRRGARRPNMGRAAARRSCVNGARSGCSCRLTVGDQADAAKRRAHVSPRSTQPRRGRTISAEIGKHGRARWMAGRASTPTQGRATVEEGAAPRRFSALRNRNFALLWVGLVISNSGSWMQIVAQGWLVYNLTDSPLSLGLVGAARA